MRLRLALLFSAVLVPTAGGAQEVRQPLQELFLTETVYPQERHEVQITLGALIDRSRRDPVGLIPFSVEYGITDRWQLEGGWDGYTEFQSSALSRLRTARLSIGTKYSFMEIAGSPVHAALGVDIEWPQPGAFAPDEGEEGLELEPFVAVAADIGRHLTLVAAAGLSVEPRASQNASDLRPDDTGHLTVGALIPFRHATIAVEYTPRTDTLPWRLPGAPLVTPSITLKPNDHWELAVGAPVLVSVSRPQAGIALRILREF